VPTNQQRREAERRRLQRQLEERRAKELARRRFTLIISVVATIVVIAGVVVGIILATSGGGSKKKPAAAGGTAASSSPTATAASSAAASTSAAAQADPPAACRTLKANAAGAVSFDGVTISNATNVKVAPKITSTGSADPKALECADVVVGAGTAAKSTSTVSVQYSGVLYEGGKAFDSSWADTGKPASFSLSEVVPGFSEGIGGAGKVAPMKVGGRRIMILPSALGYGSTGSGSTIPANAPLVFVVDLTKVS
jgi:FKBP-type peptidyl-prolyl cis-trans isomerase